MLIISDYSRLCFLCNLRLYCAIKDLHIFIFDFSDFVSLVYICFLENLVFSPTVSCPVFADCLQLLGT